MGVEIPQGMRLGEGEQVELSVEASPDCYILLTNTRLIIQENREGVQHTTPIALESLTGVEIRGERGNMVPLIIGLLLPIAGASLLPQLAQALGATGEGGERLWRLGLGGLGVGLVVAGLVVLSNYLRRVTFPLVQVVFHGAPEVVVSIAPESRRRLHGLAQRIEELKSRLR